ncbi:hypothetical protein E2C01_059732 [Portunus trituberculatus]|uniref:Uncharacterized protein n=1 Tax=Portunus trituberculatus TaxID=210409 RepID=A0A5B7H9W1_PORTR|nr:hypothetical protein [Portunus trituberculatus]
MKLCAPCHRMFPDHLVATCGLREQRYHYLTAECGANRGLAVGGNGAGGVSRFSKTLSFSLASKAVCHVEAKAYTEMREVL